MDPATGVISGTPTTLGESSFAVLVTDAVGATSSSVRALKVVAPPAGPAAPGHLAATVTAPTQVTLSWQDNASQSAAFDIELSQDGGPFVEVQAVKPQATTAVVAGLSPATRYTFRLHAANAGGSSAAVTATAVTPELAAAPCVAGATGQCLLDGRFLVEALYQDARGHAGLAHAVPITSGTAYLWFFEPANAEVVVKLLDGCALGDHFWVFAAGLTNVHVILRVTDTRTGAVRYYELPYGPAFTPIQDTAAFGTCGVGRAAAAAGRRARRSSWKNR
jgi:Fibronectin type III domain